MGLIRCRTALGAVARHQGFWRLWAQYVAMLALLVLCSCAAPARTGLWSRFAPPHAAPARSYTVKRGDTQASVARHFNISADALRRVNGLGRASSLRVGARLHIPEPPAVMRAKKADARRVAAAGPTGFVGRLRWPVRGVLTSPFGRRWGRVHDGIDIGVPRGTGVMAVADGEVVFSDNHGAYGNVVIMRHAGGMMTVYAHAERNLVRQGDKVRAGQVIARVGSTGRSTGPHLHFEVRRGVQPENPLLFLPP
jgi:murein DD-endopeptidase MepM/ murein hydrolase activator NlpD